MIRKKEKERGQSHLNTPSLLYHTCLCLACAHSQAEAPHAGTAHARTCTSNPGRFGGDLEVVWRGQGERECGLWVGSQEQRLCSWYYRTYCCYYYCCWCLTFCAFWTWEKRKLKTSKKKEKSKRDELRKRKTDRNTTEERGKRTKKKE